VARLIAQGASGKSTRANCAKKIIQKQTSKTRTAHGDAALECMRAP
jgi:hypothetical protein